MWSWGASEQREAADAACQNTLRIGKHDDVTASHGPKLHTECKLFPVLKLL